MNKEQTLAAIAVMQAYVDGKTIERLHKDSGVWLAEAPDRAAWDWNNHTYRIKPEPREYWLVADRCEKLRILSEPPRGNWFKIIHVREIIE